MGMPVITASDVTREQAITDLIQSVALEEAAIAHILNAEGEKMQKIIAMEDVTVQQLMDLNDSVLEMVKTVTELEKMLKEKLALFASELTK